MAVDAVAHCLKLARKLHGRIVVEKGKKSASHEEYISHRCQLFLECGREPCLPPPDESVALEPPRLQTGGPAAATSCSW